MTSLAGHLLVATPELADPNFVRTVIYLFAHSEDGAAGVVLNRPTGATVTDISEKVFEEPVSWDKPIHLGGPVAGPLMVLHSDESLSDQPLIEGLYHTIDSDKIRSLILQKTEPSLVVANYSGWGAGQLEMELAQGTWLWLPARLEHVFANTEDDLWESVSREIRTTRLSHMLGLKDLPPDPRWN